MDGIMSSKLFATRQGTIFLGVIVAVIAAIALIVYLNSYRNSVNDNAETPVLVAKRTIDMHTTGAVIKASNLYTISKLSKSSLQPGAFVDPSELDGKVVVTPNGIGQGQQLTAADFGPATGAVSDQLSPNQRAVVIPLGTPQQVGGQIGPGSHVDVWITVSGGSNGSRPTTQQLFQDVDVLGASGGNVTLRLTSQQAGQMIFASQSAQPWLVLRPVIATSPKVRPVTGSKAGG